jgi:UBX domain-containing protein 1/4
VKAQIEADRKARAAKAAQEKALREGQTLPEASTSAAAAATTAPTPAVKKEYTETRLQV